MLFFKLERRTIDSGDDRHEYLGDDDVDGTESHPNHQLYQDYGDVDLEDPWPVTQRPTPFTVRPTLPVGQVIFHLLW